MHKPKVMTNRIFYTTHLLIFLLLTGIKPAQAQMSIEEEYDLLTSEWLLVSEELKTYGGLSQFCTDADYRDQTLHVLNLLHHYDSLLLNLLMDPTAGLDISHKEYKNALADLHEIEDKYDPKTFMAFLRESCITRNELERDKENLMKASGMYSYDGQLLMLETQQRKFLKQIDKRVTLMDEHVHKIHPSHITSLTTRIENQ